MNECLPEILAPVGGSEQLYAAVRSGANAVYLGVGDFNARRNADNFTEDSLCEAVRYCHASRVKVYVTLNTLVFDDELPALYETIRKIVLSDADAVIVQDFAVARAVKEICPEMPLHGSTQMAVHNVSGAKKLEELGFRRVVLAREMTLSEIRAVKEATSLEIEAFVHGAHCMSASGNCYLSAMLGERSGNRGKCAQGCRLDWQTPERSHALSLKDMSLLPHLLSLCDAGVISFKIEGRMKRPEYVAAAVTSAKKALAGEAYDTDSLQAVFSRSGFTDGYLTGKRTADMFGFRGKEDVTAAKEVLGELAALYRTERAVIPLTMDLTVSSASPARLTLSTDLGECVTVTGPEGEAPLHKALSEEIAARNLGKLGGTPFTLAGLTFHNPDSLTLPASALNAMRREGTEALTALLTRVTKKPAEAPVPVFPPHTPLFPALTHIRLQKLSQYSALFADCAEISLPVRELLVHADALPLPAARFTAELPDLFYPGEEQCLRDELSRLKALGISKGASGNLGGIRLLQECGFAVSGTHALNITNTASLTAYEALGLHDTVLSFELTFKKAECLGGTLPRGAYVYGYLPLMLMRACPFRGEDGCQKCSGNRTLIDRRGTPFPTLCREKAYTVLLNSVPLYTGNKALPKLDFYTLFFTVETKEECEKVFRAFCAGENLPGDKTNGLAYRTLL